jgi:hypothetical protein
MKAALLLAGFLGLAVATFAFCFTATQEPRQPLWDKSPEVQAAREAHIAKGQGSPLLCRPGLLRPAPNRSRAGS